jgi:hypothetical protein
LRTKLVLSLVVVCVGCGDPYEGKWEGVEDADVDLDVTATSDGYTGDGHIYLCDDSSCFLCGFDFDGVEVGDRIEVNGFFTGDCSSAGNFTDVECTVNEDRMECDLGNGVEIDYERVN